MDALYRFLIDKKVFVVFELTVKCSQSVEGDEDLYEENEQIKERTLLPRETKDITPFHCINTNEIPRELSCENMITSHKKITCYLHKWKITVAMAAW